MKYKVRLAEKNMNELLLNTLLQEKLFSYTEDANEESMKVIRLIKENKWDRNPDNFIESFKHIKHPKMLTIYSPAEFKKMKTFKVPNYNIGFALKEFDGKGQSEIVAVHNGEPTIKGIGAALMDSAVKNGGKYLDHFDGFLSDLYQKAGFVEYKRYPYDPQYDEGGEFKRQYGARDVIYRHHSSVPAPE